jgi:hypothetical protein
VDKYLFSPKFNLKQTARIQVSNNGENCLVMREAHFSAITDIQWLSSCLLSGEPKRPHDPAHHLATSSFDGSFSRWLWSAGSLVSCPLGVSLSHPSQAGEQPGGNNSSLGQRRDGCWLSQNNNGLGERTHDWISLVGREESDEQATAAAQPMVPTAAPRISISAAEQQGDAAAMVDEDAAPGAGAEAGAGAGVNPGGNAPTGTTATAGAHFKSKRMLVGLDVSRYALAQSPDGLLLLTVALSQTGGALLCLWVTYAGGRE